MQTYRRAIAVATLSFCLNAHALVIDDFSVPQATLTDTTVDGHGVTSQVMALDGSILGGYRDLSTVLKVGVGSSMINVSTGLLNFNTSAGTVGSGKVVWDGDHGFPGTVDPTGLGGIDLLGSGTGVRLNVATNAAFPFALTIYTDALSWTTVETTAVVGSFVYTFPFADFTNPLLCGNGAVICGSGGVVNVSDVGALELDLNHHSTIAVEASIGSLSVVPEPNILSLIGISLCLVGAVCTRR